MEQRPPRRFEDAHRRIDEQLAAGELDAAEARWHVLRETLRAQHVHQAWEKRGAPRRRSGDAAG